MKRLDDTRGQCDPDTLVQLSMTDFGGMIQPLQIESEFKQLVRRVAGLRPRCIVEIGTARGGTLFALTRVAADDAIIISVDLPGGVFGGGYPAWKRLVYQRFASPGQTMHLLRADSHAFETFHQVRQLLGGREVDVLFIDGDHTYAGAKHDFDQYKSLVRSGGLIALHDIAENRWDQSVQVDRLWSELKLRGEFESVEEFVESFQQGRAGVGVGVVGRRAA